jgi:hypothetical protein
MRSKHLLSIILILLTTCAHAKEYGLSKGVNVNLRKANSLSAEVIKTLNTEPLIYLARENTKEKISGVENYWYKVQTLDGKTGWLFGEFFELIDNSKIPGKFVNELIDQLANSQNIKDGAILKGVQFQYLKKLNILIFKYIQDSGPSLPGSGAGFVLTEQFIYEIENDHLKYLISSSYKNNVSFDNNYIFDYAQGIYINVYDKKMKEPAKHVKDQYKITRVDRIHINVGEYENFYDKDLKFDNSSKTVTVQYRQSKASELITEKYRFNKGKFEKIQ